MKKLWILIAMLLMLALLASCSVMETLHDVAEQLTEDKPTEDGAPVSDPVSNPAEDGGQDDWTDDDSGPEEEDYPSSQTDAGPVEPDIVPEEPSDTDFTALSASECVADIEDVPNGRLPRITISCAGASDINDDIDGRFGYLIGEDYCRLNYEAYKAAEGRYLSVLVVQEYDNDCRYYTPYVLDVVTGEQISGGTLLAQLNVSPADLAAEELEIMEREFEYAYASASSDDDGFYEEQRARTASEDNADTERIWLGDGGQLMFVAKIYSLAGAEFYEYPMSSGYSYP